MASRSSGPASDQAQTLQRAIGLHQQGQLGEAERLYRQILNVRPDQFEARHLLGLIRYQQGRNREAIDLIGAALKQRPDSVVALSNYGLALEAAKRFEEFASELRPGAGTAARLCRSLQQPRQCAFRARPPRRRDREL